MASGMESDGRELLVNRETRRLFDEVCERIFGRLRLLPAEDGRDLLGGVRSALEREIAAEQRFQEEFGALRDQLPRVATPAELARLHRGLRGLATAHFSRRESAPAFHELCTGLLDLTLGQALRLAEESLARAGAGTAPPYAWLVLGPAGRRETTLSTGLESLLVYGPGPEAEVYCGDLARQAVAMLEACGYRKSRDGIMPDDPAWRTSLTGWEARLEELCRRAPVQRSGALPALPLLDELFHHRPATLSTPLFELADLRFVSGDPDLGATLAGMVKEVAKRHPACLQEAAHAVAALPSPFNFLGNYKLERTGAHRGQLDLYRWAYLPLIAMVRHQAVTVGIAETGTLERIQLLLRGGTLDVALGQRLLKGGLVIFRLMAQLECREQAGLGEEGWLFHERLSLQDETALREALEAVITLQKVIHSSLAGQG